MSIEVENSVVIFGPIPAFQPDCSWSQRLIAQRRCILNTSSLRSPALKIALSFLLSTTLCCNRTTREKFAISPIQCDEPVRDIGDIILENSQPIFHRFAVVNKSNRPLPLSVKADCGCVATDLPAEIRPGSKAHVSVSLSLPPSQVGAFSRSIEVLTGPRESNPPLVLRMQGFARPTGRLTSNIHSVKFSKTDGRSIGVRAVVRRQDGTPLAIKNATCDIPGTSINIEVADDGRSSYLSIVAEDIAKFSSNYNSEHSYSIELLTDHNRYPKLVIPAIGANESFGTATRESIAIPAIRLGEEVYASILRPGQSLDKGECAEIVAITSISGSFDTIDSPDCHKVGFKFHGGVPIRSIARCKIEYRLSGISSSLKSLYVTAVVAD